MKKRLLLLSICTTFILSGLFYSCSKITPAAETGATGETVTTTSALNTAVAAASNASLITYKNSAHEIYAGFYRVEGPCYGAGLNGSNFSLVPDSLDVLILFCFSATSPIVDSVPRWVGSLHAKGTKVIVTGNLNLVAGATHDSAGYAKTAKYIMDSIVNRYGLDGYDIDVESNPTGSTLTDMTGVYKALSKYLGPKSGTGKLLTFDTNQSGSNGLFRNVYSLVSYVWLQAYGRGSGTLQSTWNTFSPYISSSQFVPGFSFYEENGYPGNYWDDVHYPINGLGTGTAYDYARWEPTTPKKGGVFGYAIDRDGPLTSDHDNTLYVPNYIVSRQLIQIMNPAAGSGGTTGVVFYQNVNYGGTATQALPVGSYTLSQLQAYGFVNDWASSVKIPSGRTVTMYSNNNFSGTSWVLTANTASFLALSPNANDVVSSVKIQ